MLFKTAYLWIILRTNHRWILRGCPQKFVPWWAMTIRRDRFDDYVACSGGIHVDTATLQEEPRTLQCGIVHWSSRRLPHGQRQAGWRIGPNLSGSFGDVLGETGITYPLDYSHCMKGWGQRTGMYKASSYFVSELGRTRLLDITATWNSDANVFPTGKDKISQVAECCQCSAHVKTRLFLQHYSMYE